MGMVVWQDRQIDAGEKWHPAIQDAMADAVAAVLLISADYLASGFCIKEEVPYLLDRQERAGMRLVPVLIRKCPWKAHRWLAARQMLPRDGKCVAIDFPGDHADGVFSEVAELVLDHLSKLASDPEAAAALPKAVRVLAAAQGWSCAAVKLEPQQAPQWPVLPAERIDLTRLPETGAALFGRDQELQLLDAAWSSAETVGAERTRILAFTAHGGVGKSTLVNHWLREVQRDHFRSASRVFGWSFYSQGTRDQTASADAFIDAALRFFGDPDPAAGSPWDKGERLARRAGAERALLVLDGLEPLQSGHAFDRGKLRDPALASLLRGLARQSAGLCLITTREPLPDLAGLAGVTTRDLEQIAPEAGRALLRTARVVGTDAELEGLAKRFGPHALAVSLLGVYLYENDPRHGIGAARALEQLPGNEPIDRVLAGFEQWLAASAELEVLQLLGLFDRPADAGCLGALRAKPPIPGLTEHVVELSDAGWDRVLDRLEKLRLVHAQSKDAGPPAVDAHPLLREHFAKQLRERQPEAWREGHRRLYEHLKSSVAHWPEGLASLQPLYQAVAHGCKAGLHQQACVEVYQARILRGEGPGGYYSTTKLGAYSIDLGAVTCFFEDPWKRLAPGLCEADQAWLLGEAAFRLRALGQLSDSLDPLRLSFDMDLRRKRWGSAATKASNLSEVTLAAGQMAAALRYAAESVDLADRSDEDLQRVGNRTTLGDAQHQSGQRADAVALFRKAEALQAVWEPPYSLLYALQGFRYCDLLLADAERMAWATILASDPAATDRRKRQAPLDTLRNVEQRAAKMFEWRVSSDPLLAIGLEQLTQGRAALYRAILQRSSFEPASEGLTTAANGLRAAGDMLYIPRGLLTRAWLRFVEGDTESAKAGLDEAWEIAERGAMKLHMADILLHRARLFRDKSALAEARKLIEQCGYGRRKEELQDAEDAAKDWPDKPDYPPIASATETTAMNTQPKRFRIALSFPGEHRAFVEQVAKRLASHVGQERVLYDKYYEPEFARPDLDTYLQRLYHDESELIAVFLCTDYERKEWCGLEWRALRDLVKRRQASAIMPLRFDNTEIPGLFSIDGYVWIGDRAPHEVADLILQRLQINPKTFAPPQPVPPAPPSAARKLWQEKLAFLQAREAVISDPAQLFTLKQQIEEAKAKVREYGGQP